MDSSVSAQPPRYFWRRIVAYGIDATLCWIVVALFLGYFGGDNVGEELTSTKKTLTFGAVYNLGEFRPPFYLGTETCGVPPEISPVFQSMVSPSVIKSATLCFDRRWGIPTDGTAILQLEDAEEVAGKEVNIPLTINGVFRFADILTLGVFLFLSVISLRLYRTTPGKKLMKLRVDGRAPLPAFRREITRNAPNILIVAVIFGLTELVNGNLIGFGAAQPVAIAVQLLAFLAALGLWVWPMVRWRGAMLHDRWNDLSVTRS